MTRYSLEKIIPLIKQRITKLSEVKSLVEFLIKPVDYQPQLLIKKGADKKNLRKQLVEVEKKLVSLKNWQTEKIYQAVKEIFQQGSYHKKHFYVNLYLAIEGKPAGLPLFDSLEILGREESLKRLENAQKKI